MSYSNAIQQTKAAFKTVPGRDKHSHGLLAKHARDNRSNRCPVCGRTNCHRKHTITVLG